MKQLALPIFLFILYFPSLLIIILFILKKNKLNLLEKIDEEYFIVFNIFLLIIPLFCIIDLLILIDNSYELDGFQIHFPKICKLNLHDYHIYKGEVDEYRNKKVCIKCGKIFEEKIKNKKQKLSIDDQLENIIQKKIKEDKTLKELDKEINDLILSIKRSNL